MISIDEQMQLIKRGCADLIDEGELRKKLGRGKPLTVKAGFDLRPRICIWGIPCLSTSCVTFRNSVIP